MNWISKFSLPKFYLALGLRMRYFAGMRALRRNRRIGSEDLDLCVSVRWVVLVSMLFPNAASDNGI